MVVSDIQAQFKIWNIRMAFDTTEPVKEMAAAIPMFATGTLPQNDWLLQVNRDSQNTHETFTCSRLPIVTKTALTGL